MIFVVFLALFLVNNIDCKDVKRSMGADKGDPLTWLLLNQIQKIDSTLEKLQESNDQLEKKMHKQEKESIAKDASIQNQIVQLSNKISGVSNQDEVKAVKKKLVALETVAKTHLTATELANSQREQSDQLEKKLEKAIRKQKSESMSRTASIEKQIAQLSNRISGLSKNDEVEAVKKKLAALETVARTHLTSRDLITTQRELNSLKGKVSNLERQVKVLECPYGQKKWQGSCYFFGIGLVTWSQARDKCASLGGHLVKVDSAAENRMLFSEAKNSGLAGDIWMGASDINREGTFRWVGDNSRLHFGNWYPGEPNNSGNQDCGKFYINYDFRWDDTGCYNRLYYICEKRL